MNNIEKRLNAVGRCKISDMGLLNLLALTITKDSELYSILNNLDVDATEEELYDALVTEVEYGMN